MKVELFVNPDYSHLSAFIKHIPEDFGKTGKVLHTGRNELRVIECDGVKLVAKSFNKITLANRLIFAASRWSKANKTYNNAIKLINRKISTPAPVAYINIYNKGLLVNCYYICLFSEYRSVEELFLLPITEAEEGLKAFAHYTVGLYKAGVYHGDYNLSNVLYQQSGHNFDFTLIDINRMQFRSYSKKRGLHSLRRLQLPIEKLSIVVAEFARESNADTLKTLYAVTLNQLQFKYFKNFMGLLKRPIKYFLQSFKN